MSHFLAGTLTDKELQDLRQQYSGGSISGHLGEHKPQRIEAPAFEFPHPGVGWEKGSYNVIETMEIVPDWRNKGYMLGQQGDEYWVEFCDVTPEVIDEIIAKLEHFKRVVFGASD